MLLPVQTLRPHAVSRTLRLTSERGLTDGQEGELQLQGEGGEGDLLRRGQHRHGAEVGGLVARVPLASWGVKGQAAG